MKFLQFSSQKKNKKKKMKDTIGVLTGERCRISIFLQRPFLLEGQWSLLFEVGCCNL